MMKPMGTFLAGLASTYLTLMILQHLLVGLNSVNKFVAVATQDPFRRYALDSKTPATSIPGGVQRRVHRSIPDTPDPHSALDGEVENSPTPPDCGELPPFGDVYIRHPRRPGTASTHTPVPTLMVSFESDRLFASPLHGQSFDMDSTVYVFLDGPLSELLGAEISFQLDGRETLGSATGVPFDFLGLSEKGHGPNAVPLRTATLGAPGCHRLTGTVQYKDGTVSTTHAMFETINRPQKVWLIATVSVDDAPLLGFFLDNYLDAGVPPENFVVIVHAHTTDEAAAVNSSIAVLRRNHIKHIHVWEGAFNTFDKFELQESFGRRFVLQQDWVMHPDVDEHHKYPGGDLLSYLQRCNERGVTTVIGKMQDRVAYGGILATVVFDQSLDSQFPLVCSVTKAVIGGATTKVVLHRGFLIAEEGGYHTLFEWKHTYGRKHEAVILPPVSVAVAHFKWTSTVADKLRRREDEFKKQGIRWWVQSARLRLFVKASGGSLNTTSPELKCTTAPPAMQEKDAWPLVQHKRLAVRKSTSFTVIMMSFSVDRAENQNILLRHFANMHCVYEVVFIWNGAPIDLPPIPRGTLRPIRVRQESRNSLNNRWNHTIYPQTDAVLMIDDDQFLPAQSIASLFARWQHEPNRVVGVVGRNFVREAVDVDDATVRRKTHYVYPKDCCKVHTRLIAPDDSMATCGESGEAAASWCDDADLHDGSLSMDEFCDTQRMVLPKGMFFHRKYMRLYSHWTRKKLRAYVDKQEAHCDDVAFNFLVANETGLPGVVLDEEMTELVGSSSGLFNGSSVASKQKRLDYRTECVAWIAEYFDGVGPPPFRLEPAAFHLRLERTTRNPVVFASRRYSIMWNLLDTCIAENGQRPR